MALPLDLFAVEYKKRRPQADEREILEAYTQVGGGKPEGFIGFGQAFGSGIMSGFYGLGSALGSFGELVGLDTGGFASDMEERARQYAPPEEVQQYLYENPSKIFDPNWLAYTTGQVVPSALLTILGGGIAGGAAKIAGLGQKGVRAAQIAGAVVPGTALEAGGFYRETPDRSQALLYGLLDAPLQILPAERLFRALGGTRPLASLVQAAAGESLQEWSEEPLAAAIRGDDIMQAMKEGLDVVPGTFLSTLLTGGLGVGVGQLRGRLRQQEQPQTPTAVFSEAIPSKELPEGAFLEESSPVVKDYITRQAAEILTGPDGKNALLSTLGIEPVAESPSVGAYDESLNPNIVTVLPPGTPQEVVDLYAKSLRYIYKQDTVPWSQIQPVELPEGFSGNTAVGVRVGLENADQETQRKLFKVLRSYLGKDAGFTVMPDDGSALIVNYGGMDDAKFVGRLISMAKRHADDLGITEVAQVSSIGDYNGEQGYWKSDPEGRNLYDEIRQKSEDLFGPRGREFHRQVRDRRAAFDGLLQKEIGQDLLLKDLGAPAPKKTLKPGDPLLQETITKPGREKLQQSLIEKAFENVTPSDQPVAVLMGGGGASGKGFVLNMLQESGVVPKNAVTINPDDVKPLIPEYKEIAKKGDYRAAEVVHEESSKIASDIMQKAIEGRYNLIIDKTLGNPDKAKALIQSLKEQGYRVELYGVTTPTDNAIKQMVDRAKRSGRHVRVGDMLAAHKGFASGFEDYARLADRAALIHNQGKDQSVAASAENGQIEIIDPERYNLFTQKARLNPNARAREEIAGDTAEQAPVRQGTVEPAQEGTQRYALTDYLSGDRLSTYEIRVWHGSGDTNITQFSTDYVLKGKGEGAVAYGWGLYFTDKRSIAEWYKKNADKKYGTKKPDEIYFNGERVTNLRMTPAELEDMGLSPYISLRKPEIEAMMHYEALSQIMDETNSQMIRDAAISIIRDKANYYEKSGIDDAKGYAAYWNQVADTIEQMFDGKVNYEIKPDRWQLNGEPLRSALFFHEKYEFKVGESKNPIVNAKELYDEVTRAQPEAEAKEALAANARWSMSEAEEYAAKADKVMNDIRSGFGNQTENYVSLIYNLESAKYMRDRATAIEKILTGEFKVEKRSRAAVYEVELNVEPDHLLDWDKRIDQMPERVKNTILKDPLMKPLVDELRERSYDLEYPTGEELYKRLGAELVTELGGKYEGHKAASNYLKKRGINGIQYLAGVARKRGEGPRNYVVFDDSVIEILNKYQMPEQMAMDLEKLSKHFDEKGFMMRRGEVTDKLREELRIKVSTFEQMNLAPLLKKAGFKNPQPVPQELLPVLESGLADVLTVVPERAFRNIGAIFVDEFDGDAAASYSPPTPRTPGLLMVNRQQLEALNTGGYPNLERDFRFTLAHELTHAFDIGLKGNVSHAVASELFDWDPLEVDAKNVEKDGKIRAQFDPGPGAGEILYEIADYWNKNDDRIAKLFNYPFLTMGADLLLMRKNMDSIEQATGMKPEQIRDAIRKLRRGEELYPEEQLVAMTATPGYIELVKDMTQIRNHFNAEILAQLGAIYSTYPEELKAALPQSYKLIEEIFNGPATSSAISAAVRESPESDYYDLAGTPRWAIAGRGVEAGAPERYPLPAGVDRSGAQSYGEYVETRRRGTQPWELTEELARELGVDPARVEEILRRRLGEAYNAEQIENVGLNLRQSVQRLYDYAQKLAEKAKTGEITDTERLQFEQYEEELAGLVAEFFGVRAEAGRALNILKKLSGTTQQAQVIRDYLNSKGGADLVDARIELMANMDPETIEGRQGIARGAAIGHKITAWDMLVEYYKAMLLTGPPTHVVNAVSNETRNIIEGIENFVTAGIGLLRGNKDRLKFKAAMEYMNAHLTGLSMGVHEASKVKLLGDADAEKAEIFKEAIPGKVGKVIRIPFQLLSKLDAINRTAAYHQTLRMLAVQKGLDPNEVTQNPPKELREEAEKQAARLIYTDTGGPIVQALNQMRSRVPALNFIFPFVRTPANIVRDAMRHMPGVSMLFSDVRAEWNKGGWYRDRVIARQAVGFAIGAVVWQLAAAGLITGGPPDDPAERRAWELEGIQPWSIKIGDTWYAYNRIDPIGILFGLAADAWRFKEALGTKDADKLAALVMGSIASNLTNKTYLSGLSDLISAMQDPLIHADRAIKRFAGSLIVPTGVAYVARAVDPYLRQTETIMDAVRARIPVMSRELAPKLDVVGRPRMRESGPIETMISPIWKRTQRYDRVAQELMRLQVSFPYPPKKYRGVKLDPEVRNELITTIGRPTYNVLKRLVKTKSYNAFPDPVKKWILERVISRVRSSARLYWSKLHPEIMREARQLELEKYLGR